MSLAAKLAITATAGGILSELRDELSNLTQFNKVVSVAAAEEVRNHLIFLNANIPHRSATALGARPTQHYAKVARSVESGFDEDEAFITVPRSSGLSRAFGDLEITPKNGKKWLTIPAHKSAYGRSAREFEGLTFVFIREGLAALFGRDQATGEEFPMFWLKKKVTIKQDRDLLPSDEVLTAVAEEAAGEWLRVIISNKGGLN